MQEESPEGMITVDIVPDSDLEQIPDLNHCPDQGNANINVQFLTKVKLIYWLNVLLTIS